MRKIGKFFKKVFNFKDDGIMNRKKIVMCAIIAILGIVAIIVGVLLGGKSTQEKELTAKLEELGVYFYEEYYYDALGDTDTKKKELLSRFTDIGIKVNLENLVRMQSEASEELKTLFVNEKTSESCDFANSRVIIYPQEGYKKEDYKIVAELKCGFGDDEKEETTTAAKQTVKKAITTTTTTKKVEKTTKKK